MSAPQRMSPVPWQRAFLTEEALEEIGASVGRSVGRIMGGGRLYYSSHHHVSFFMDGALTPRLSVVVSFTAGR